jgi:2,5-dioxopentanoate dehydrogenase
VKGLQRSAALRLGLINHKSSIHTRPEPYSFLGGERALANQKVLIAGKWREAATTEFFQADNPATRSPIDDRYPISSWADCHAALDAATKAHWKMRGLARESIGRFLEGYAAGIEARTADLVAMAAAETALPAKPRLTDVELPRTTSQLRQAAAAARDGSWALPTIDSKANIRSYFAPLGPVWVFGPNNFPFAFNSVAGGDFAAAIAAGNPVIAKANSSHPGTTRLLAEAAHEAATQAELPPGAVQLLYRVGHADGERAVADPRTGATGYTGSRKAGLALKAAADKAGKPIYLELSSVNPLVILPGALVERGEQVAADFVASALMGGGQFCTNPGLVLLLAGAETERFIGAVTEKFRAAPVATLLSNGVAQALAGSCATLIRAGARALVGGNPGGGMMGGRGYCHPNTLLRVSGEQFIANPAGLQTEAFGNASLLVVARDIDEAARIVPLFEGALTGCFYTDTSGADDQAYEVLAPRLRPRVGRLLNDKMPTGVAVSPAMNHGGPYPATGHPGFTAVGIPASLRRFAALECFDNVRPQRLPAALRDKNPIGNTWRLVDGSWTQGDTAGA